VSTKVCRKKAYFTATNGKKCEYPVSSCSNTGAVKGGSLLDLQGEQFRADRAIRYNVNLVQFNTIAISVYKY
jgi:hypothetical protein